MKNINELKEISEKELYNVHKALEANFIGLVEKLEEVERAIGNANSPEELKRVWASYADVIRSLTREVGNNLNEAFASARNNVLVEILGGIKKEN